MLRSWWVCTCAVSFQILYSARPERSQSCCKHGGHIYTSLVADGQHTSQSKCQTYQDVCNSKEQWKANYCTNGGKRATLGFEAVNVWRTTAPLVQYCDLCCLQSWLFMKQPHILHGNWSHIGAIRYNTLHMFCAAVYFRNLFMVCATCILLFQRCNF